MFEIPDFVVDAIEFTWVGSPHTLVDARPVPGVLDALLTIDGWWATLGGRGIDAYIVCVANRGSCKNAILELEYTGDEVNGVSLRHGSAVVRMGEAALDRLMTRLGTLLVHHAEESPAPTIGEHWWEEFVSAVETLNLRCARSAPHTDDRATRLSDEQVAAISFVCPPTARHLHLKFDEEVTTPLHGLLQVMSWDTASFYARGLARGRNSFKNGTGFALIDAEFVAVITPLGNAFVSRTAFDEVMARLFGHLIERAVELGLKELSDSWWEAFVADHKTIALRSSSGRSSAQTTPPTASGESVPLLDDRIQSGDGSP